MIMKQRELFSQTVASALSTFQEEEKIALKISSNAQKFSDILVKYGDSGKVVADYVSAISNRVEARRHMLLKDLAELQALCRQWHTQSADPSRVMKLKEYITKLNRYHFENNADLDQLKQLSNQLNP